MTDFADLGFTVRHGVLNGALCGLLHNHWRYSYIDGATDTRKDIWQHDRVLFDLATDRALLDPVCEALNDNAYLWGACFRMRSPGQIHNWHCDVETMHAPGFASVWIGVSGTNRGSALSVIPGSHLYGRSIQDEVHGSNEPIDTSRTEMVTKLASKFDKDVYVETPNLQNGDALIFDGQLWHGSNNQLPHNRLAVLIQYAKSDIKVREKTRGPNTIPPKFEKALPQVFPIDCKIEDLANPVTSEPANGLYSHTMLGLELTQLDLPLKNNSIGGWKRYIIARGTTPNVGSMSVHASTLAPGKSPHPPHNHLDEEILMVLHGEADIVVCEDAAGTNTKVHRMKPGGLALYAPYQFHTIVNNSDAAVNYLMFRWSGNPCHVGSPITKIFHSFSFSEPVASRKKKAVRAQRVFKDQTHFLDALECHVTNLDVGGSYASHVDEHDVAIVVFEGEVEINGQSASQGGVYYIAAGTPHDMKNIGRDTARYVVFEFHAGTPDLGRKADRGGQGLNKYGKRPSLALQMSRRVKKTLRELLGSR